MKKKRDMNNMGGGGGSSQKGVGWEEEGCMDKKKMKTK